MIFETLHDSSQRGELLLVNGGMCHWHLRRDGQLTIREIISTQRGAGSLMLRRLMATKGARCLYAKCPADLPANEWYSRRGFVQVSIETTKTGRALRCWQLDLIPQKRRANVGDMEIVYCADGNPRFAEIAIDAGLLYGARLPSSFAYAPYFADQDWKTPNREKYMAALSEHRPHLATVLDWEHEHQFDEVMSWAMEAAQYVSEVIIIPKVNGGIERLPRTVGGKPVRLGYSVPTQYGGTRVPLREFEGWPVHLLGGSPDKQMKLARVLNVRSADTNYTTKIAHEFNKFWTPDGWTPLECIWNDGPYEAFARSCHNIMHAWRELVKQPLGRGTENYDDLPLFQKQQEIEA